MATKSAQKPLKNLILTHKSADDLLMTSQQRAAGAATGVNKHGSVSARLSLPNNERNKEFSGLKKSKSGQSLTSRPCEADQTKVTSAEQNRRFTTLANSRFVFMF